MCIYNVYAIMSERQKVDPSLFASSSGHVSSEFRPGRLSVTTTCRYIQPGRHQNDVRLPVAINTVPIKELFPDESWFLNYTPGGSVVHTTLRLILLLLLHSNDLTFQAS